MTDAKPARHYLLAGMAIVSLVCIAIIWQSIPPATEHVPDPPPTDAQLAEFVKEKAAALGVIQIRRAARNPDAFKLSWVSIMPKGTICYEYRGQNGFGGMNVEHAVMDAGHLRDQDTIGFATLWNRRCVGSAGRDVTADVNNIIQSMAQ